eukprot:scaffold438_cov250-Pinguiococcus_pyrenoidosus.AAC.26
MRDPTRVSSTALPKRGIYGGKQGVLCTDAVAWNSFVKRGGAGGRATDDTKMVCFIAFVLFFHLLSLPFPPVDA